MPAVNLRYCGKWVKLAPYYIGIYHRSPKLGNTTAADRTAFSGLVMVHVEIDCVEPAVCEPGGKSLAAVCKNRQGTKCIFGI
jgi:hypothetical protein